VEPRRQSVLWGGLRIYTGKSTEHYVDKTPCHAFASPPVGPSFLRCRAFRSGKSFRRHIRRRCLARLTARGTSQNVSARGAFIGGSNRYGSRERWGIQDHERYDASFVSTRVESIEDIPYNVKAGGGFHCGQMLTYLFHRPPTIDMVLLSHSSAATKLTATPVHFNTHLIYTIIPLQV
jgi:hypothetical protein